MTIESAHELLDKFYTTACSIDEIDDKIAWSLRQVQSLGQTCKVNRRSAETSSSNKATVAKWRASNPKGSKTACANDTDLSRPTVYKYWNER